MYKDFKKTESLDTGFVGGSGILWMFSGIVLGLLVGLAMYYFSNMNTRTTPAKPAVVNADNAVRATKPKSIEEQQLNDPKVEKNLSIVDESQKKLLPPQEQEQEEKKTKSSFSYYAVLPNLNVPVGSRKPLDTSARVDDDKPEVAEKAEKVPKADTKGKNKASAKARKGSYALQIASFKRKNSANRALRSLARRGISANIQKKKIKGRLWYRISTGPVDKVSADLWKKKAEKLGHKPRLYRLKN